MSDVTIDENEPRIRLEDIRAFMEGVGRGINAMVDGITTGLQRIGETFAAAREARIAWLQSDEGQRWMRQQRDLREIRSIAYREKRTGKAEITRMFDDLYDELGIERQEDYR